MKNITNNHSNDVIPSSESVGVIRIAQVIVSVAITIPAFLIGAELMASLGVIQGVFAIVLAGMILALIASLAMYIGAQTRQSTYMIIQTAFGYKGAKFVNALLSITLLGWFGVTVKLFAETLNQALNSVLGFMLPEVVCVLLGSILMVLTAVFGFRAIDFLARVTVPLLTCILLAALYFILNEYSVTGLIKASGEAIKNADSKGIMAFGEAVSIGIGGFMVFVTITPDYARFAKRPTDSIKIALLGFGLGYSLVLIFAGLPSVATGNKNITITLIEIGLGLPALLVIIFATWTTNIANLYSSSLAMAQIFPNTKDMLLTVLLGVLATGLVILGVMDNLVAYLIFLSVTIPPVAGIFITDFFLINKGRYDSKEANITINIKAFIAWIAAIIVATLSSNQIISLTTISALDALLAAATIYWLLNLNK